MYTDTDDDPAPFAAFAILTQVWLYHYISYDISDGLSITLTLTGFLISLYISLFAETTEEFSALFHRRFDDDCPFT